MCISLVKCSFISTKNDEARAEQRKQVHLCQRNNPTEIKKKCRLKAMHGSRMNDVEILTPKCRMQLASK